MEKYAMYLRKSRADLEAEKLGEGETLARHKKILTALAVQKNLYVEKIYQEIVSGDTIAARPQIQALINDCYAGKYRGIICMDVDRLSRGNQADMQTIMDCLKYGDNQKGLLCVTPAKTYDVARNAEDEEYMEFVLFMSRREYKTIRKRMERGRLQSVIEGNYIQSYRPYGYDILKTRTGRTLQPNPEESEVVRKIFNWAVNDNLTPKQIAYRLTRDHVPTYGGQEEWAATSIRTILTNPIYIGKIRWNYRTHAKVMENGEIVTKRVFTNKTDKYMEVAGKHPALVSEELFDQVKDRYNHHRLRNDRKLKNPLAGLIRCVKCKRALIYSYSQKSKHKPRLRHQQSFLCDVKSVLLQDALNATVAVLQETCDEFQVEFDEIESTELAAQEQIAKLDKQIEQCKRKLEKVYDAWEDGILSDNEFIERKTAHLDRIEELKQEQERIELEQAEQEGIEDRILYLGDALNALLDTEIDAELKNEYLKRIIDHIDYDRIDERRFSLDIYLK